MEISIIATSSIIIQVLLVVHVLRHLRGFPPPDRRRLRLPVPLQPLLQLLLRSAWRLDGATPQPDNNEHDNNDTSNDSDHTSTRTSNDNTNYNDSSNSNTAAASIGPERLSANYHY